MRDVVWGRAHGTMDTWSGRSLLRLESRGGPEGGGAMGWGAGGGVYRPAAGVGCAPGRSAPRKPERTTPYTNAKIVVRDNALESKRAYFANFCGIECRK